MQTSPTRPADRVLLIQTHVQEYRLAVFDELHRRLGSAFEVWSGLRSFSPTVSTPALEKPWHRLVRNRFFLGRRLLWQSGLLWAAVRARICIVEYNPRILSNWVVIVARRLLGRETAIWGHLFPRAGEGAPTRTVRFLMLQAATRVNLYTHAEADALAKLFPDKPVNVSPNAVMRAEECRYAPAPRRRRYLYVARLFAEKKPLLLLEAFARARVRLPDDVRLDFVGDGPLAGDLARRTGELGLEGRVGMHGGVYATDVLQTLYDEALASVSPGYVGLSATQSFGFGVPMLIARGERHSVEIALCEEGFNCEFFESDSVESLAEKLVDFVTRRPAWDARCAAICERLKNSYTLDQMCDGFMHLVAGGGAGATSGRTGVHIAIAWMGLPYYAARVIHEAQTRHPEWRFTIISSRVNIPYEGIEELVGGNVHWIDERRSISWQKLGTSVPDVMLLSSWPHAAYNSLARQANRARGTPVICMVDNYLRHTPKQLAGYFYFRLVLRRLYAAMWVPGAAGERFMRYLGVPADRIYTGLYAGDDQIFQPPPPTVPRNGLVFVGQLVRRKGLKGLASVCGRRAKAGRPLPLRVVGAGPLEEFLRASGIDVQGFVQPRELAGSYHQASALILPSRIDHWGVVMHEAALCGCLLLATRQCGSCDELIEHGANGFVMQDNSESEIEAALGWWENLGEEEIRRGRRISVELARRITPRRWADTLDEIVTRFARAGSPGAVETVSRP